MASQVPTARARARSFPVHRVRVQSPRALRSHPRVQWHRPHPARALVSPAHVAMNDRVQAEVPMIALAVERKESADL